MNKFTNIKIGTKIVLINFLNILYIQLYIHMFHNRINDLNLYLHYRKYRNLLIK